MIEQKRLGHYVCVCVAQGQDELVGNKNVSAAEHLRKAGIEVFTYNLRRSTNPVGILKAILRVKRLLVEQRIEALVCHTPLCSAVGRIAARLAKTPHVIYFAHGLTCAPAQGFFSWQLRYWAEKLLGSITDAIIVMNDYDEKLCRTHHIIKNPEKIFRIPGIGVDLSRYNPDSSEQAKNQLAAELSISKDWKIVLFVGRMIYEKGAMVLAEAVKRILAQRDDVCSIFVGRGPLTDEIQKLAETGKIASHFKLVGWREDVFIMMKAADIFVLPTYYYEGLPVSILEAMACSKPVVATQHRGCEDVVVDGQTGFLVPVKQAEPLADKLLLLLDDEQLRRKMGQAGRLRVEQHFELSYCTKKIAEALEKAIG
jgi:glycosyltransferase involved in cell wall biosynthesis